MLCLLRCLTRDLDLQMVSVGPAFKGIKMIPPGPHFVYYSSSTRFCLLPKQAFSGNLNAWILNLFVFFFRPVEMETTSRQLLGSLFIPAHLRLVTNAISFILKLRLKKFNAMLFFTMISKVIVRKWDEQEERLVKLPEEEVCVHVDYIIINIIF